MKSPARQHASSNNLEILAAWRSECDYDDLVEDLDAKATESLILAQRIINAMR